jgi:hypothetical protein
MHQEKSGNPAAAITLEQNSIFLNFFPRKITFRGIFFGISKEDEL